MYPESTVQEQQNIPAVTRAPMASAPYSTVPQMTGYARSGPPQQQHYNMPNYNGWAPQPQGILTTEVGAATTVDNLKVATEVLA